VIDYTALPAVNAALNATSTLFLLDDATCAVIASAC
jgi:hypothetical protein